MGIKLRNYQIETKLPWVGGWDIHSIIHEELHVQAPIRKTGSVRTERMNEHHNLASRQEPFCFRPSISPQRWSKKITSSDPETRLEFAEFANQILQVSDFIWCRV